MAISSTPISSRAPNLLETSAREAFFGPLAGLAESSPHARSCPGLPDAAWLRLGIARTLHSPRSGRGFLQTFAPHLADCPDTSHFFEILKSPRRAALVADVAARLARQVPEGKIRDRLKTIETQVCFPLPNRHVVRLPPCAPPGSSFRLPNATPSITS